MFPINNGILRRTDKQESSEPLRCPSDVGMNCKVVHVRPDLMTTHTQPQLWNSEHAICSYTYRNQCGLNF